jgi:hypothetical protein
MPKELTQAARKVNGTLIWAGSRMNWAGAGERVRDAHSAPLSSREPLTTDKKRFLTALRICFAALENWNRARGA